MIRLAFRPFAALALLLLVIQFAASADAQSVPLQVIQGSDGTLYLAQASTAWTIVPNPIADSDLAALTLSGELDGAIPAPFLSNTGTALPLQAVQSGDGALYLVQGSNAWVLVPTQVGDPDLGALSVVGEVDGTISSPGVARPATPTAVPALPTVQVVIAPTATLAPAAPTPTPAPLAPTAAAVSPLEGTWVGTNASATVTLTVHVNGGDVSGTIRGENSAGYVVYQVVGTFSNGTLRYSIPAILEETPAAWCPPTSAITTTLTLSSNRLDGTQTGSCSPGPVHFVKT